jgi:flagellar hook protein FlgE
MFTSFASSLSALSAQAIAVDVVGNNLANVNTPGFKNSTVYFRDLVTQAMGSSGGELQVGLGVGRPITVRQFAQGSIQASGRSLDAAIQGDGFFITRNKAGNTLYTRSGNFQVDLDGHLLTATGERVQGWTADPLTGAVNTSATVSDIVLTGGSLKPPRVTTQFSLDLNLDSSAEAGAASTFSTPMEVFDTLGTPHALTVSFTKTGPNTWQYDVSIPGGEVSGGTAGVPFPIPGASGTLTFGADGRLTDPPPGTPIAIDITGLNSGASDMHITWDLYTPAGAGRLTQFGQASAVSANSQNGTAAAQLVRVGVADGGRILAQYSNGLELAVGQLALAAIVNPESLVAVGNNMFQLTARSATPVVGVPGTGGRGEIVGGATEYSTVDIAREFTQLIVLQRGYQANSRVITTADELSQETLNLKR